MVCIDTYRVLDSCRDKDCFEDVRVFLTAEGQEIIDRTGSVRAKSAEVLSADIDLDTVPFNKGFYQIYIRVYVKITCEACVCPGSVKEFEGLAAVEKKVILFGGEGSVSVFKSDGVGHCPKTCAGIPTGRGVPLPVAVIETVDPIVLGTRLAEPGRPCRCQSCASVEEIPEGVFSALSGELVDCPGASRLLVSLGLFSVVRIERPAQYLVNAVEYSVPEKECVAPHTDDPCTLFRQMAFPTAEFASPTVFPQTGGGKYSQCGEKCGCRDGGEKGTC